MRGVRPGLAVALETAPGAGAVAVLALSGPAVQEALAALAPSARALVPGVPRLATLSADGTALDEALVLLRGSNRAELHLHGSPAVVAAVVAALAPWSAADSAPQRSVEQRPVEQRPIEHRAVAALARAKGEFAARVLLDQAEGALRREIEAALLLEDAAQRGAALLHLARRGRRFLALTRPPRVVLAGPVNAGKSTLFNAVLGRDRALVSPEAGTTRDALTALVHFGELAVELVDTAGERPTHGPEAELERAGQRLARELGAGADLVLWLSPGHTPVPAPTFAGSAAVPVLSVLTHADLAAPTPPAGRWISARDDGPTARRLVAGWVLDAFSFRGADWPTGQAVPFEAEMCRALEAAAAGSTPVAVGDGAGPPSPERFLGRPEPAWWD